MNKDLTKLKEARDLTQQLKLKMKEIKGESFEIELQQEIKETIERIENIEQQEKNLG